MPVSVKSINESSGYDIYVFFEIRAQSDIIEES